MSEAKKTVMRDAYGEALVALAEKHPELVVLDADVSSSTKSGLFGAKYPERFFNVGVAEANMVDIAAGLATAGLHPVVNTFALFLALKTTDQIRNVLCYNKLPVVLAGAYSGLSDSFDGASHQSITDVAIMRAMPNMTVFQPADSVEVAQALEEALKIQGPVYLRISRNAVPTLFEKAKPFKPGKARLIMEGKKLSIFVSGVPTAMAIEAAKKLAYEKISCEVVEISTVKPLDEKTLVASAAKTKRVLVVEEHNIIGGVGGAVAELLGRKQPTRMDFIGVNDTFTESGPYDKLLEKYGISVKNIIKKARALVGGKK